MFLSIITSLIFFFYLVFGAKGLKGRDPKLNLYTEQKAIFKPRLKEVKGRVTPGGQEILPDRGTSKYKTLRQAWRT